MPALRVALAVLAVLVSACAHAQEDPFNVLHHLASKAPYWPLGVGSVLFGWRDPLSHTCAQSLQEQTPPPATCQPVHIDLVLRHGTRNPSDGDIEEFALLESAIALHADDLVPSLSWIAQWHNPIPLSQESDLAPVGRRENYQLGKRYMAAFPSLFAAQPYVSNLYYLRSTQEQRAMLSAESFAYGVFEGRGTSLGDTAGYEPVFIRADTESNDNVLKFYDNCPLYNVLVNDNDTANLETELYMDAIIGGITQRLTQTITSNGSWAVTREDALAMWAACQMEGNQHGVVDKWCALFTTQEILDFEYAEDLDDYWTKVCYSNNVNSHRNFPPPSRRTPTRSTTRSSRRCCRTSWARCSLSPAASPCS